MEQKQLTYIPDGHMVLLYKNDDEVTKTLVEYISDNLTKNVRCIYITGDADTEKIISNLKKTIDYDSYIYKGQFIVLDKSDAYSKSGAFEPDLMVDLLISEANSAKKDGFEGLAITGEISWVLEYDDGFDKIMEYEWKINDQIFSKYDVSSICRYNMNKFTDEMIINIIQVHPFIIWNSKIHENPFYVPADGYKLNRVKEYQVEQWLKNMTMFTNVKSDFTQELRSKEQKLLESEKNYRYIFDNSPIGNSITTLDGRLNANKAFYKMLGYTREELEGKFWEDYTHPDDIELSKRITNSLINEDKERIQFTKRYIKKDGSIMWAEIHSSLRRDEYGEPMYYMTSIIDITKTKETEEALIESQAFLEAAFENSQAGIAIANAPDGKLRYVNRAGLLIRDKSEAEVVTDVDYQRYVDTWNILHFDGTPYKPEEVPLARAVLYGEVVSEEFIVRRDNHEDRYVLANAGPIRDKNNNIIAGIVVFLDITERKQLEASRLELEAQVRNKQKLESIGTLASGVAHEINNPINGIMNYGQIILDSDPNDEDIKLYAKEIVHETNRIAEIVRNLLNFSRKSGKEHSYAIIEDIINQTVSLINTVITRDQIELEIKIDDNLSRIKCRSQQIQQVIMNLMTNSQDALNDKYKGYHENKIIKLHCSEYTADDRKWLRITVEDHGNGIPDEIIENIFDPFFTTKGRYKGTGLGLSISYGIVEEHHGNLRVETKENEYTKFILELPCDNGWDLEE